MANTYTQLYYHVIFVVKGRRNLISVEWKAELYKYITGIVTNKKQKLISINGASDHIHILVGLKPDVTLSDVVRDMKANASRFINDKKWIKGKFEWQKGFGAFTVSHSQLNKIINYINNQEEHHKKKMFKEEYIEFLKSNEVDFNPEYLFDPI